MAAAVTVTDAILAFPFAYFAARLASRRLQAVLFSMVLLPLWSSYLARVYAWRLILSKDGALNWTTDKLHLGSSRPRLLEHGDVDRVQLHLVAIHDHAGLGRDRAHPGLLPRGVGDLGASQWTTFRRVLLPLVWPGIVAGSIFTFSLTLGDYITPTLVGGASSDFIGNVVYSNVGVANNVPFAAAFATVPVLIMGIYLTMARRAGATEAL